jgi:hypothetical protein
VLALTWMKAGMRRPCRQWRGRMSKRVSSSWGGRRGRGRMAVSWRPKTLLSFLLKTWSVD